MTMPPAQVPSGWHPDPWGRYEFRYWDGVQWTPHVSAQGRQLVDAPAPIAPVPAAPVPAAPVPAAPVPAVAAPAAAAAAVAVATSAPPTSAEPTPLTAGSGSLFTEPMLVIAETVSSLKGNSFAIGDGTGTKLATAQAVGGSTGGRLLGGALGTDKFTKARLEVTDAQGRKVLAVSRPAKVMKSRVIIEDGNGLELGVIRQESAISGRFAIESGGTRIGSIQGEGVLTKRYLISDTAGTEVARISMDLPPDAAEAIVALAGKALTGADLYILNIHQALPDPLRSLVVAASLAIDIALHQD